MSWANVAVIAEIVSSFAVVVTLVYLSIQTKQASAAILAASRQGVMAADVDQLLSTFSNPEMAGLLTRQPSELTDAQNMSVSAWFAAFLRIREFAWFQYRRGIMDESTWRSYVSMAKRIVQLPALGPWWTLYSQEMDVGFRAYIDELLKAKP